VTGIRFLLSMTAFDEGGIVAPSGMLARVDVVLFGATGMVGQGVLRECLLDPGVHRVLSIGRTVTGLQHPKLREIVRSNLYDYSDLELDLAGYDACFFSLGTSAASKSEEDYRRVIRPDDDRRGPERRAIRYPRGAVVQRPETEAFLMPEGTLQRPPVFFVPRNKLPRNISLARSSQTKAAATPPSRWHA
jgi:hypothetical protein